MPTILTDTALYFPVPVFPLPRQHASYSVLVCFFTDTIRLSTSSALHGIVHTLHIPLGKQRTDPVTQRCSFMLPVLLLHAPMTQCPYGPMPQRLREDIYRVPATLYQSFVLMISHKIKLVLKLRIASDSGRCRPLARTYFQKIDFFPALSNHQGIL
ncbi:MAG: hypothetical protein EZS28_029741, partial [Streblomastix strix]